MLILANQFLPPKSLWYQKRYLCQGLFNPRDSNIRDLICHLNNIVEYIEHLPPLSMDQGLPDDKIIELVRLSLRCEWKNHLPMQGFNLAAKSLNEIVEICKWLNTSGEIFKNNGDGSHPNKNPTNPVQSTTQNCWIRTKGKTIPLNPPKKMHK